MLNRREIVACSIGLALVIGLPLFLSSFKFAEFVLGVVFVYLLWTAGMNLLYGYTGLVPLTMAGVAGLSGYSMANLVMKSGWSFWLAMPLSSLGAALIGVILGLPALRLRGFYFVLSSLVIQTAMTVIFVYSQGFTNGDTGISEIPPPAIWLPGRGTVSAEGPVLVIMLGLLAYAGILGVHLIARSRMGAFLVAIKEDDLLAETLGIDITRYKVLAFFVASLFAAIGGSFYASFVGFISPRSFDLLLSVNLWLMVAFGGGGSVLGPIIGAVILVPFPFMLQELFLVKDVVYGLLILLVGMAMPHGIYGAWLARRKRVQSAVQLLELDGRAGA